MRKLISTLLIVSSLIVACNDGGKKDQKDDPVSRDTSSTAVVIDTCKLADVIIPDDICQLQGAGNFIIPEKLASQYVTSFKNLYIKPNSGIQEREWVKRCQIKALVDFFDSHDGYDGAWIVMTAGALETDATSICFVPSKPISTGSERHQPDWAAVSSITSPACDLSDHFLTSSAKAAAFRTIHRKETVVKPEGDRPLLSRRIWINACVFRSLNNIMNAYDGSSTPMNGLFVYGAAYDPVPQAGSEPYGYIGKDHSTVILVLSYQCKDIFTTYPAWKINYSLYDKLVKMAGVAPPPLYNHGELCPNACTNVD